MLSQQYSPRQAHLEEQASTTKRSQRNNASETSLPPGMVFQKRAPKAAEKAISQVQACGSHCYSMGNVCTEINLGTTVREPSDITT